MKAADIAKALVRGKVTPSVFVDTNRREDNHCFEVVLNSEPKETIEPAPKALENPTPNFQEQSLLSKDAERNNE